MNWNTITIIFICSTSLEGKISPWFLPPYFLVNNEVMSHHVYTLHSQCPHHSPLPTGKMTVRNWEKRKGEEEWREGEGRELTKSCLTFTDKTEPQLTFVFFITFSSSWLVAVRLLNKDYQIEKYWTFSNSKGFHTDFVFKNIMWEIRGANKPEPLHFPLPPAPSTISSVRNSHLVPSECIEM